MDEILKRLVILDAACGICEGLIDHKALSNLQDALDVELKALHLHHPDFDNLQREAVEDFGKNLESFGWGL